MYFKILTAVLCLVIGLLIGLFTASVSQQSTKTPDIKLPAGEIISQTEVRFGLYLYEIKTPGGLLCGVFGEGVSCVAIAK